MANLSAIIGVSTLLAALGAPASNGASYRIELTNGTQTTAIDRPIQRGTVLTFHTKAGAPLTGVPSEMVLRIVPSGQSVPAASRVPRTRTTTTMATAPQSPLQPGEVLEIGATGGSSLADPVPVNGAVGATGVAGGGSTNGVRGALANPSALTPNLMLTGSDGVPRAASSTDVSRGLAAQNQTGANGFPATASGATTVVGPNGTPTLAPGLPGASTLATGANGTPITATTGAQTTTGPNGAPVLAQSGQPGSAQQTVGPNGTPVMAQPGQPGSAQPIVGPNGTPVMAQPGQPGSAQPIVGPNGTPVLAQPGQPGSGAAAPNTAPNGTPASAAPNTNAAPSGVKP